MKHRLARGDTGVNALDEACREHDIAYSQSKDITQRHRADRVLAKKAWERLHSADAGFGEKSAALAISGIMRGKTKLGMGHKKKRKRGKVRKGLGVALTFGGACGRVRRKIKKTNNVLQASKIALSSIGRTKIKEPKSRIIRFPKSGGLLPLVPIFSVLSALGSLGGGAAAIAKAVTEARTAAKNLMEKERHNKVMEKVSIGKGLFLGPYKKGLGLYLRPSKNYR